MKRTINEIYDLIKQKIENAENQLDSMVLDDSKYNQCLGIELKGEINAYTDVKILIETSGVLEDE